MSDIYVENRASARTAIDAEVDCQFLGLRDVEQVTLDNISATGLLLWSDREVCPRGRMRVWLASQVTGLPPIDILAEVVRTELRETGARRFGYGCRIIDG